MQTICGALTLGGLPMHMASHVHWEASQWTRVAMSFFQRRRGDPLDDSLIINVYAAPYAANRRCPTVVHNFTISPHITFTKDLPMRLLGNIT